MGIGADELAGHNHRRGNTGWCSNGTLITPQPTPLAPPNDQIRSGESIVLQTELKEPGYYTLQFFLNARRDPLAPGITYRGKAEILWTVLGNTVRRVISVYSGAAISGAGGYVQVSLKDDSYSVFGGLSRQTYPASIILAKGTRASTPQPPVLYDDEIVNGQRVPYTSAPGSTLSIPVPDDSGVNQVLIQYAQLSGTVAPVSPNDLVAQFSGGITTNQQNMEFFNRWMPVPSGAEFLQLFNRSATETYRISPVWGVEG